MSPSFAPGHFEAPNTLLHLSSILIFTLLQIFVTDLAKPAVTTSSSGPKPKKMESFADHFWNQALTLSNGSPAFEPSVQTLEDNHLSDLACVFLRDQSDTQQDEFLETALSDLQQGQNRG